MPEELPASERAIKVLSSIATKKADSLNAMAGPLVSFMEAATVRLASQDSTVDDEGFPLDNPRVGTYMVASTMLDLAAGMNAYFLALCLEHNLEHNGDMPEEDRGKAHEAIVDLIAEGLDLIKEDLEKLNLPTTLKK